MSNTLRPLAVAVVALIGASGAFAQNNSRGVRQAPVVAPVPAMMMQQELNHRQAVREAQLWQMYQPPVVIVNNPWASPFTPPVWQPGVNFNSFNNTPGALWNSQNTFYRNNNLNWNAQPSPFRPVR